MTSTNEKTPAQRQLSEGRGTHMTGGSAADRTDTGLAGLPAALSWATKFITAGGAGVPDYGSPEWEALPDGPAKVAAVVVAAECWRRYTDPAEVAWRLRIEIDAL